MGENCIITQTGPISKIIHDRHVTYALRDAANTCMQNTLVYSIVHFGSFWHDGA